LAQGKIIEKAFLFGRNGRLAGGMRGIKQKTL
jgi:hypothetical protein